MKKLYSQYVVIIATVLSTACSPQVKYVKGPSSLKLDSTSLSHSTTEALIAPYKTDLDAEMNEILVYSADEFPKERGKPETKLGNFVADLCMQIVPNYYNKTDNKLIDFSILNFGGLRSSLPKGKITKGKVFELMPFENELVVITISDERFREMISYLNDYGGQPVSGITLDFTKEPQEIHINRRSTSNPIYHVLTTDYLANGGDKMDFFNDPLNYEFVGIKLRDAIIQYCIQENNKGNKLTGKLDNRIIINEQ